MEPYNPAYFAVGLDVDGVVADCMGYCLAKLGLDPATQVKWAIDEQYGKEVDEGVTRLLNSPATWVSLPVLGGAVEAVRLLYTATGSVPVFISSMPARFEELRIWWLREHFGKVLDDNIFFLCAASADKPEVAKQQMLTHFVEDKRTTANAMAMAGLTSILVPTKYHNDGDIHPRVQVKSLAEFARDLQTLKEAA